MRTRITKKHFDYLVLLFASILSISLVMFLHANKLAVSFIVVSFAVLYLVWGIIHHRAENTLHKEVIMEYLIFSILGALLVIGLI